jgi:hypothetical protein
MCDRMDGMPSIVATALRAEFVPCLDNLDDRIKTTEAFGPLLDELDAQATALRANFVPRLDDLDDRITTMDAFGPRLDNLDARVTKTNALLMAKIANYGSHFGHITRTAIPGVQTNLMTLAALPYRHCSIRRYHTPTSGGSSRSRRPSPRLTR